VNILLDLRVFFFLFSGIYFVFVGGAIGEKKKKMNKLENASMGGGFDI
jgi:hypothetical protein